jgi:hypothetical protein
VSHYELNRHSSWNVQDSYFDRKRKLDNFI